MASGATPLTSAARRGFQASTDSAVFSNPVVCASMKAAIRQAVANDHVQHRHQQREIGSRPHRQIQVGVACNGSKARIGNDQLGALVAGAPDVVGGDGRTLADIGADHQQDFGFGDIVPGVRRAVHTQRAFVGGAGRYHAQAAVVIDVAGPQTPRARICPSGTTFSVVSDAPP